MYPFRHKFVIRLFQLFAKFLTRSVLFFLEIFKPFKKHGIALLVSSNQNYHTEHLNF